MRESQWGFSYSFSDMWQVPILSSLVIAGELGGAAIGYFSLPSPEAFTRLWLGGVLALIPAFPLGLLLQWKLQPERLAAHAVMVRRLGLIAALLVAVALCVCLTGFSF